MLYSFNVAASAGEAETIANYIHQLVLSAKLALDSKEVSLVSVSAVCVYLDGVDNGDVEMEIKMYQACLGLLLQGFEQLSDDELAHLKAKNWVALTLSVVLEEEFGSAIAPKIQKAESAVAFG